MSKLISITEESLSEIIKSFTEQLSSSKFCGGEVFYKKSLMSDEKATLHFTEKAWLKMQALIFSYDKEVAWHGIAKRGDDPNKNDYFVTDIIVYPQEVTGGTVNTDQEKYQTWLMSQDDDIFSNIRMQGHSHVNMGVTPSGVDTSLYEKLRAQFTDETFYIFMIWNKKNDKFIQIYDMPKNILFETADVTVDIIKEDDGILSFIEESKEKVKEKSYSFTSYLPTTITEESKEDKTTKPKKKKRVKEDVGIGNFWREYYSSYHED